MGSPAPLPALLSQLLVAFTIEFDNTAEQRIPHRTARGPAAGRTGLWLVSQAMWANFLRFVDGRDLPLDDLDGPARMTNLGGLTRWGYLRIGPEPRRIVRLTPAGRSAADVFRPLAAEIETRWAARFGTPEIAALRGALGAILDGADRALPRHLPVTAVQAPRAPGWWVDAREDPSPAVLDLSALLAQVLLLFTAAYDEARVAGGGGAAREGALALPVAANALRVLTPGAAVPVRDLPRLAGVSREQIASSVILLERAGHLVLEPDPAARGKRARLTGAGAAGQDRHRRIVAGVEQAWRERFGGAAIDRLTRALAGVRDQPGALVETLTPPPAGWRANSPYTSLTKALLANPAAGLPHYPMVSHRGGYPDGS
jgi:hypothetical protein